MTGLRWRAAIVSILLGIATAGVAQQDAPAPFVASPSELFSARETLDYAVEWRLIPAGSAKVTWSPLPASGASASEVELHLESTGLVSRLYRVNDDYTSMLGQNFCGQSTFMAAHEGNRSRETRVTFDQLERKVHYAEKDLVKNSTTTNEVDVPSCTHDILGGLLVLRMLHLEPGKTVQIPVSDG